MGETKRTLNTRAEEHITAIVFPAVLCGVTLCTCRHDGCEVFFSSYIQCSFCFSHCEAVYVGEIKRTLNIRAEEHITAVKSASKKGHTAEHCWKYNHDFDWKHKKVLNIEKNWLGYATIKNDRSTGARGGVAFLVKHGLVINKEYRNTDFNIITDNEALVIDIDLSNNQNLILATIYCPNGNPNLKLFTTINNLSDNVMFVGDFNSKLEAFGYAKKSTSGPMLKNIQSQLNLIYLNTDEHTHLDKRTGNTYILAWHSYHKTYLNMTYNF